MSLCAANPLSTQDDVALALREHDGAEVYGARGESAQAAGGARARGDRARPPGRDRRRRGSDRGHPCARRRPRGADGRRDGGDDRGPAARACAGRQGQLACPVLAVNESRAERSFNDRYGTGQSTVDGILRATNLLLAGRTFVVFGYGYTGRGVALRARGAGASVVVCEVDPVRALEARMEGYEVMPALEAAEARRRLRDRHGWARRSLQGALRTHEGRRGARERRPLRRRDIAPRPARARRSSVAGAAARRAVHACGRAALEPARGGARGEPRRWRRSPGGGDGHLVRDPGALRRVPRASRGCARARRTGWCRRRSTRRSRA